MLKKLIFLVVLVSISVPAFAQNPDSIPFAPAVPYWVDVRQFTLSCADLDGDVDLDIAVAHSLYYKPTDTSWVSILKNNGDATFYLDSSYEVGRSPLSIFCADLDGDKAPDLAEAANEMDSVYVLRNNGDGTFRTKVGYATRYYPSSVFCADLDGDKNLDLAVADYDGACVSIFKNNGDGTFQPKIDYNAGGYPYSVFCADLDGDTYLDLATANFRSNNISILKNNGDGTFQTAITYASGKSPISIFASDLDGDSYADLVVANLGLFSENANGMKDRYSYGSGNSQANLEGSNLGSNSVTIFRNRGDGSFDSKVDYASGGYPWSVYCADLDGDFDKDIAIANGSSKNVAILENNGDGTFKPAVKYDIGTWYLSSPNSVFCADLDGDKDLELVVGDQNSVWIYVLKNLTINLSRFTPLDEDSVKNPVEFSWQALTSPHPEDTVRYNLYLSRSERLDPDSTLVYYGLFDTVFTDSLDLQTWYWRVKAYNQSGLVRYSDPGWNFYAYLNGDCNGNGKVGALDVVYLINFLFKYGPAPNPFMSGDANRDGVVTINDVVYLFNYLFKGGPAPGC